MSDLTIYRLGDVCKVINGRAYAQHELLDQGKYKVLRVGNFFSNNSWYYSDFELEPEKYCDYGDLLFAWSASFGPRIWSEGKTIYHYHIWKMLPDEKLVNKKYLYYLLQNRTKSMLGATHGSIMLHLTKVFMEDLKISVPKNVSTQQKIAAVLSALDAKIELNARINAELELVAKTLYDYWFVQFAPHKSAGGKMVWNEALKREIPLGWEVAELGNFAQPIRGVTYKKDDIKKSSDKNAIPILRATNITNGVIDLNDMVYVPEEVVSEEQYLNKFDVLITMSSGSKAHVGKNAFYYFDQKVSFGAFCSKLSVNKIMRFYVNTQMQSDSFKKYIANVGLGTNINNLTNKHITEYKLLIPPKELLLQYENTVEGFYTKIGNNMKESQTLTELRDWLLPMLMNGQVTPTRPPPNGT